MKRLVYFAGRALQLLGLFVLPSSIWVGFMDHNESGCIVIFLGSIAVFYTGYLLTVLSRKL